MPATKKPAVKSAKAALKKMGKGGQGAAAGAAVGAAAGALLGPIGAAVGAVDGSGTTTGAELAATGAEGSGVALGFIRPGAARATPPMRAMSWIRPITGMSSDAWSQACHGLRQAGGVSPLPT